MSNKRWRCIWLGNDGIWGSKNICYYCGQRADCVDHVIPKSALRQLAALGDEAITKRIIRNRALKVWCCHECNCLLSDSLQESLPERKAYLKAKLKKKYKRTLNLPRWEEDEIAELGYNLRVYVVSSAKYKEWLKLRVGY